MLWLVLLAVITALTHERVWGEECPCQYLEADPLFPGSDGFRWDCEYVAHGLTSIPTACWLLHPDVTQIFLGYNEISEVTSQSLAGVTNLQTLSFKKNKITVIPPATLNSLSSLEFLDLSSNYLSELPTDLWTLTTLTHLYLGDNQLNDALNYNISNLVNVEVLDLHLNQLSELPSESVSTLSNLHTLHLYWNSLVNLPLLTHNLHLQELLVNGNALLEFPKYMFGNLTQPLTYHFVDNPAYDVWATMLLPLPERSHIMMGNDVWVWAEDDQQALQLLYQAQSWVILDGLSEPIDLTSLLRICGVTYTRHRGNLPPC
ncbi:hypothetical protein OTU49_004870 [Cherax quadricarinatus]|uniref:Uncharacterized protein n=1 Tax=Cherax quadricarinatus TaxID=27406 RepID=A0AAW0X9G1_CHEQU|nr:leucine-rich repeat-containing G-protein coupled receptor 5-like [Cherax quadricarinatus]